VTGPRNEENIQKLAALVKGIRFAMLTTADSQGELHSRPMATQQIEFDGDLWFFTRRSSDKVSEVEERSTINVAYTNVDEQRYVSVAGVASIVRDKAKMAELWNPTLKIWFKDGLEDPELCLLKVEPQSAEYWESASNKLVRLAGFVAARVTGNDKFLGDNARIDFH
jgi:general stress protein 26